MNLAQRIGQEFKTLRDDELSTKQESLVSGTNIKTINGASVLGSGDIDLSTSLSMVGNELRYTNIDGTVQAVDMSPFMDDTTNTVVSASLSGTSIIFTREDATTFTLDVSDLYDDTNLVTSVAGRNGAVILDKSDVGLGNVDNTADSAKNVLSATKLTTTRTISLTGDVTGSVSFDGSGNAAITTTVANDSHTHAFANITSKPTTLSGYGITDAQAQDADLTAIAGLTGTSGLLKKTAADTWTLDTTAYTTNTGTVTSVSGTGSYGGLTLSGTVTGSGSLTLGGTPTGSWPISVTGSSASTTGNAATATKLATARTINGVSFDGTANITVADSTKLPLAGGSLSGSLSVTGDITASGNVTAYSDKRLKTNIEVIPDALNKVCSLSGYTYDRTDLELRQTGLIAQELLSILPEAVSGSEEEYYGVNYGSLVGLLVEAIKEQQKQIEELKKDR